MPSIFLANFDTLDITADLLACKILNIGKKNMKKRKNLSVKQIVIITATGNFSGNTQVIQGLRVSMTAFEIISVFIGVLALLMFFGSLLIALLAFFDKRNERK